MPSLLLLAGCASDSKASLAAPENSHVVQVSTEDAEVNAAQDKAKRQLPAFIKRLMHPNSGERFSLKAGLPTPDGSVEHIWIENLSHANGKFKGTLGNDPDNLGSLKFGSKVTVSEADVNDWLINTNGRFEGGYSVDVLFKREGRPPLPR